MADLIISLLRKEIEQEAVTTRKMLALVPDDKHDWKPHEKSMAMKQLALHIADIPSWSKLAIDTESINFADSQEAPVYNNNADLLAIFDKSSADGAEAMSRTNDEFIVNGTWTMFYGDHKIGTLSKYETIRHSLSQTAHHRAQLGVYLRLLNIPIPGSYGPSADDSMGF